MMRKTYIPINSPESLGKSHYNGAEDERALRGRNSESLVYFITCANQPGQFAGIGQSQPVHGPGAGNVKQAAVVFAGVGFVIGRGYDHLVKFQPL